MSGSIRRALPIVLLATALPAQSVLPAASAVRQLRETLDEVRKDPAMRYARLGFRVEDPAREEPLIDHNGEMGFMTASNMKLISSAVALAVLGSEFRYETRLVGYGEKVGSEFRGDLMLVGSGDPTLGATAFEPRGATAPFERMTRAVAARGIRRVRGRVLGDDSVHPDEIMGRGWDWSYHADWYAAQVSGLCFNENCIDFILSGTQASKAPLVRIEPATEYVRFENAIRCVAGTTSEVVFSRALGTNRIRLTGTFAAATKSKRDWASVDNPTAFAATVLRETLARGGVRVTGAAADLDAIEGWTPSGPKAVLHVHRSPPMSKILFALNKRSQNLYAEQVVRTASVSDGGDGSMGAARRLAGKVLTRLGVDTSGLVMADASGLTRLNLVQPRHLTGLLKGMLGHEGRDVFYRSLPVAGVDGTLRRRFPEGSPARGRVRAKTGYISRVVALSGYVPRTDREPLVFSILVNDFHAATDRIKRLVDRLVDRLTVLAGR